MVTAQEDFIPALLLQIFSKMLQQFVPRSLMKGLCHSFPQEVESISLPLKFGPDTCLVLSNCTSVGYVTFKT